MEFQYCKNQCAPAPAKIGDHVRARKIPRPRDGSVIFCGSRAHDGTKDRVGFRLSTRNYGAVVKDFHEAYGVEKSAVSDNFIAASREKLQELMERPLGELRLCAVLIDGTPFRDRQMIVALGINSDGRKTVLGLREGATENATVVSELLSDLASRGLDFSVPRLYVLVVCACPRSCAAPWRAPT